MVATAAEVLRKFPGLTVEKARLLRRANTIEELRRLGVKHGVFPRGARIQTRDVLRQKRFLMDAARLSEIRDALVTSGLEKQATWNLLNVLWKYRGARRDQKRRIKHVHQRTTTLHKRGELRVLVREASWNEITKKTGLNIAKEMLVIQPQSKGHKRTKWDKAAATGALQHVARALRNAGLTEAQEKPSKLGITEENAEIASRAILAAQSMRPGLILTREHIKQGLHKAQTQREVRTIVETVVAELRERAKEEIRLVREQAGEEAEGDSGEERVRKMADAVRKVWNLPQTTDEDVKALVEEVGGDASLGKLMNAMQRMRAEEKD